MSSPAPDLSTEQGRADYRRELRRVAQPYRWGGLALILLAAVVVTAASRGVLPEPATLIGYGMLALGWALVILAVFLRTRHHKRRLAEGL
ncbi:MAG TPA: hypothetical protein PLQ03_02865 [Brevundimonas sp.]|uniref:hypothetical protein n=1 Tax=Brevundimonas sp. TaxID=1871086 RepID=UPI002614F741|nr:hypothetical protein [Brevundimonas sp.]HRO32329.1 hypothetical protein [Brevundimonas sp.]